MVGMMSIDQPSTMAPVSSLAGWKGSRDVVRVVG